MLKGKLIYIFLLFSFLSFGQSKMLLASIQQATPSGPTELHTGPNAASDPAGNEASATTGWSSSTSSIDITVETTDVDTGSYAILGTSNTTTTFARIGVSFPVTNGTSYTVSWAGKEGAGDDARLYLFTNVSGSQVAMTTTWADYSTTVTGTADGTATIQWVLVSAVPGDLIYLDNLSITETP